MRAGHASVCADIIEVNTCPRESKAHVVVESSCKFGNNEFFLVRIYIFFVYPFFSFFSRGGEARAGQTG